MGRARWSRGGGVQGGLSLSGHQLGVTGESQGFPEWKSSAVPQTPKGACFGRAEGVAV